MNTSKPQLFNSSFVYVLMLADFFFQNKLFEISFRITIRVSNSLDPDEAWRFVWPDLGTNCLQRLSSDDTSRQRPYPLGVAAFA